MMKKISKLALLAAATALLFGAIGCSDEDESEPVDTVSPVSFELTSGAAAVEKDFTLKLDTTQIKADVLEILKKGPLPSEQIESTVNDSGDNITVSKIALTEDATATMLKLSLTMASNAEAGTKGTLTLTLSGDYTTSGKDVTGKLSYEIKASTTITPDPNTPAATAKTYNFVGLAASDFLDATGTAVSAWGANASWVASSAVNLPANSTMVAGATVYCKEQTQDSKKQTLIRARTDSGSKTTALNYNGGASSDISSGIAIASLDRYASIPVDGAGTITVEYAGVSSDKGSKTCQIALLDEEGSYLGGETVNTLKDDTGVTQQHTFDTTVTKATSVYIAFSRVGANGGGIDLYKIEVKPATTN